MFYWSQKTIIPIVKGSYIGKDWISATNKISIDSRTIDSGDIFIALKGDNFDGHDFINEAFNKGALAAVVNQEFHYNQEFPVIYVSDTLLAMQRMARYYIATILHSKVIAITGSIGKTTTKDMLTEVLSNYGITYSTKGNFNNSIGMPLSILNVPHNTEFLVLEMGMNSHGEIQRLSEIARPNVAVITNIEPAHLAYFSSLSDIAKAKSEIFYGLQENSSVILNHDNKYYNYLLKSSLRFRNIKSRISVGENINSDIRLSNIKISDDNLKFDIKVFDNEVQCIINCRHKHLAQLALYVFAVIHVLKLDLSSLPSILYKFLPREGRGKVTTTTYLEKNFILIDESYNANPTSVKAAIENLSRYSNGGRLIAILGDMLELGKHSFKYHTELVDCIYANNINKIYTIGSNMIELYRKLSDEYKGKHFANYVQLISNLNNVLENNDVVLIKGSSATNLNKVVKELLNN